MNPLLCGLLAWESLWWARRYLKRRDVYERALGHARAAGLPLLVVGAPDAGTTAGYGCGDLTIDVSKTACPLHLRADITKPLPLATNSAVVFVSCVLEYVADLPRAMAELHRVSGGRLYIVRVEPWTLTAYLYPGARRTLPAALAA